MTVYSTSLPSMHLTGDDLKSFEELLRKDSSNENFEFTFETNGFSYTLDSVDDFINEADLPNKSTNYQIELTSDEGEIYINADTGNRLRISGDRDWVHKKKRQIKKQIDSNKRILRTHAVKIAGAVYAFSMLGIVVIITLPASYQRISVDLNPFQTVIISIIFLIFLTWPYALITVGNGIFPYHLIKKDETVKYRPRVRKLKKSVFVLLGVIGGVAGLVTIFKLL